MKTRAVEMTMRDHAVRRRFEREQGLDVAALRHHIGGLAQNAAEFGAAFKPDSK